MSKESKMAGPAKTLKTPKTAPKRSGMVHATASPLHKAQWPAIGPKDSDIIISLLQALLEPIGQHKAAYIHPSKGKRNRKRKRNPSDGEAEAVVSKDIPHQPAPSPPEISKSITIGYNSTVRALETGSTIPISAVFVTGNPEWPPYAQLPIICGLKAQQSGRDISLMLLDKKSEAILCTALGIPRVGVLGIQADAPGAKNLVDSVTESVPPIKIPWHAELDHLTKGKWLGANIEIIKPLIHEAER